MKTNPLILTLSLDKDAFDYFTRLRDKHFPPERNFLKAHLTLFHQLQKEEKAIIETLSDICAQQRPIPLKVEGPISLGNGVAFKIASEELQQLHRFLQQQWQPFLIPQDKQKLRPHITVQNKVKPEIAKELERSLSDTFSPFIIQGTGFTLWEYLGGPWKMYKQFDFQL